MESSKIWALRGSQPGLLETAHTYESAFSFSHQCFTHEIYFSLRKWNLCVFVWKARCAQACSGRSCDCHGPGGGAWQSFVSCPASVISGHSALSESLRKGARRVGGKSLSLMKDKPPNNRLMLMTKGKRGAWKTFIVCVNEKDFRWIANLWNCTW